MNCSVVGCTRRERTSGYVALAMYAPNYSNTRIWGRERKDRVPLSRLCATHREKLWQAAFAAILDVLNGEPQ